MQKTSYREYRWWMNYLDRQWNEPNVLMYYLMQISAEVRRVLSKKPRSVLLEHFKLRFGKSKAGAELKLTKEEATQHEKARWLPMVGGMVKVIKRLRGRKEEDDGSGN